VTRVRRKLFTGEPSGRGQVLETFEVSRIWIRRHVCLLYQPIHVFQQDRAYGVNRGMPGQSLTLKPRKRLHDHWLCECPFRLGRRTPARRWYDETRSIRRASSPASQSSGSGALSGS
jgi:hypothetical protein